MLLEAFLCIILIVPALVGRAIGKWLFLSGGGFWPKFVFALKFIAIAAAALLGIFLIYIVFMSSLESIRGPGPQIAFNDVTPKPSSQLQQQAYDDADRRMKAAYEKLLSRLGARERRQLESEQIRWSDNLKSIRDLEQRTSAVSRRADELNARWMNIRH